MKHVAFALLFIVVMVCPVFAQDRTAEPTADVTAAPISIVTAEAPAGPVAVDMGSGGGDVIINNGDTATPVTPETPPAADGSLWGYVLVIGTIIVGGFVSLSLVLQQIGNRAAAAASNPLEIAVIEKAYASIPESVVTMFITPLRESLERSDAALQHALTLLYKASDGIPESEKTTPPPAPSATRQLTDPGDNWPTRQTGGGAVGL